MTNSPIAPPHELTPQGKTRRVGVELEFAGVDVDVAAQLVRDVMGGDVEEHSAHRKTVSNTPWGEFVVELDTQYAHPDEGAGKRADTVDNELISEGLRLGQDVETKARELIGDAVSGVVPVEIVTPPIAWSALDQLSPIFDGLRHQGAQGTDANPLYGFGLHLNPEVCEQSADYIVAHLQAYLLLSNWLRDQIGVDVTRRILPHTNPFPKRYVDHVLKSDYQPDPAELVGDYLADNATRNRELDFLPLFAHVFPDDMGEFKDNPLIKPRPTFHYRLPNMQLSQPGWDAVTEWNRWVMVEKLATDTEVLNREIHEYQERNGDLSTWLKTNLTKWFSQ